MTVNSDTAAEPGQAFDPADIGVIRTDPSALERFYLAFYDDVLSYLARRMSDPQDVADLVADTFVAAIDGAKSFDHRRGQPLPWLIGIARNKLLRWHRQRGADRELTRRVLGRRLLDADDIEDLERRIDAAAMPLGDVLAQLSPQQRELIDLAEIQQFTPAQVAEVLGVSPGVARIRLHRARKALRKAAGPPYGQQEET